jgi:DNA-binding NarL/FixJ family response regulator
MKAIDAKIKKSFTSKHELDIVLLFSKGYSASEIADHLRLSKRTVETYVLNMRNREGYVNVTQLACECIRKGLIK